ncbi:vitamin B12 ABC transporter ATP-binding protein BtuD [Budvicia diplopodorum]|uniref:vitamin B12 ABC transporter ATP-binding protein BtuD n=1 Tax=Budvicia diplopodorum TaxID=1119056 RepID=UPI00135C71D8|nr:vitamin B12 ABC transporter ATP-binding protein BtuD [Budvicia diplopodorum]
MLKLIDVSLSPRLLGISTSAKPGRLIHIIGPNGAGKSTLLSCIAGLLPYDGAIELNDRKLSGYSGAELSRLRAYLSQQQDNRSMMQVFQYIALHQPKSANAGDIEQTVMFLSEHLELTDKLERPLSQLSGGEWQRVRLAAIFLQVWPSLNPDSHMLLLDEPMNSLDVAQQSALNRLLRLFCAQGRTAIVSAHNLNHTLHYADEVWLLERGILIAAGDTVDVMQPENIENVFNVKFELFQAGNQRWLIPKDIN